MKKKKRLWSMVTAAVLLTSLSFGSGASAANDQGAGGGVGFPPPKCTPTNQCPIQS
ncbi:hypothetical protein [Bacillus ndiopicus]|uniref:hypothetical protein n=1 Tax=Bacillus ndiopicus TaxID=1347368 RepID=UPI000B203D39|nr:hypothetical protein [Bacillus ndiopicus]